MTVTRSSTRCSLRGSAGGPTRRSNWCQQQGKTPTLERRHRRCARADGRRRREARREHPPEAAAAARGGQPQARARRPRLSGGDCKLMDQQAKATAFRRMHLEPPILVLPNAWDVASANVLAAVKGCRALATSSAAVARSLGFEDGERAPAAEMVEAARRIAAAVEVPVTADLERGYGDPVGTARAAWDAGLVGSNFEDSTRAGIVPIEEQVEAIGAIRAAVPGLVVNARVDVFLGIGRG